MPVDADKLSQLQQAYHASIEALAVARKVEETTNEAFLQKSHIRNKMLREFGEKLDAEISEAHRAHAASIDTSAAAHAAMVKARADLHALVETK